MALPYENATAGDKVINEIRKTLRAFGGENLGVMMDDDRGELLIQFKFRGHTIIERASIRGYAAAWLKDKPMNANHKCTREQYEGRALEAGEMAAYSILRDLIKAKITAISVGAMAWEAAFLGQIMLPNGQTVTEKVMASDILNLPGKNNASSDL